jgi:uncharacterized protein YkwD
MVVRCPTVSARRRRRASVVGCLLGLVLGAAGAGGVSVAGELPGLTGASGFEAAADTPSASTEIAHAATRASHPVTAAPAPGTTSSAPASTTTTTPSSSSAAPTTTSAPTTTPTPPPTTTTAPPAPDAGRQVLALVNSARANAGCAPLRYDDRLVAAAQAHSTDMATRDYFSHTTPEGVDFATRIENAGYPNPGGENIAKGQRSADQVMQAWMNSPGHRANILNCGFTAIGVGLDTRGWYWTQDFGW